MAVKKKKLDVPVIAKKGLVFCYIGDGKGKTSAAMGVAARASGAGLHVYILQFVKAQTPQDGEKRQTGEWPLSNEINFFNEISIPKKLGRVETEQTGAGFVGILGDKKERDIHIREALHGLGKARQVLVSNTYQVVILDEIISAVELDLLTEQDVLDIIKTKPGDTHLVLTGHNKFKKIIAACDLVTEMKMVKHPYYNGVLAQRGIDF
jgi:cob(I)alamin adenosyltransferase